MLKFTTTLTEEKKEQIRVSRNDPNNGRPNFLFDGKEYYLKIKVTDCISAEDVLLNLLHNAKTVEGNELLGFEITEIAWGGIGKIQAYQDELQRFISTELEARVKQRENTL